MLGAAAESMLELTGTLSADAIVTKAADAIDAVKMSSPSVDEVDGVEEPPAEIDSGRLRRIEVAVLEDPEIGDCLKRVSEQFSVAVAMATVARADDAAAAGDSKPQRPNVLTDKVVETGETLVVTDAAKDKSYADDAFRLESGVRFYAGAPLADRNGQVFGVLSLMDDSPRDFGKTDIEALEAAASTLCCSLLSKVGQSAAP